MPGRLSKVLGIGLALALLESRMEGDRGAASTRMDEGVALASTGRHAEALEAYLWCFDHGVQVQPSFAASRLSFLLGYIMDLARLYPLARDELHRRGLAAEARILAGDDDVETIREFGAIERNLSNSERILRVFDELFRRHPGSPAMAELLPFAAPLLVEARRYEDVLRATGDVEAIMNDRIQVVLWQVQFLQNEYAGEPLFPELSETSKQGVVEEGAIYYEALLGLGREEEARRCADSLIALHSTGWSFATLIRHAGRAGAIEAARALALRGLQVVPENERVPVAEAAKQIPGGIGTLEEDQ